MKKNSILIILVLFFLSGFSQTWEESYNDKNDNKLIDVSVVTTSVVYAVGESVNGNMGMSSPSVLKTTNEGETWENVGKNLPGMMTGTIIIDLQACFFLDENTGWVAGNTMPSNCVFKTTDGGKNWKKQDIGVGIPICDIQFLDKNNGFACGTNGLFLKTNNGGDTWEKETHGATDNFNAMHFFNTKTGILVNYTSMSERIKMTKDGGSNLSSVYDKTTSDMLRGVYFVNDKFGFISGEHGAILKTEDGGQNWIEYKTNHTSSTYEDLYFFNKNYGIAVAFVNGISVTTDGGKTWKNEESTITANINLCAIDFAIKKIKEENIDEKYKNVIYEAAGYTVGEGFIILKSTRQFTIKEERN